MRALRAHVIQEGEHALDALGPDARRPSHVAPENLARYLALRHADVSDTQRKLQAMGLSSLGRSEAKVGTSLDAIISTLERLTGVPASPYPGFAAMQEGDRAIREQRDLLFGGCADDPYARIMATLPSEAAVDARLVRDLIRAGMTCARINCAHDDRSAWAKMIEHIHEATRETGKTCRILMDIPGPKCRIVQVHTAEKHRVFVGDEIVLAADLSHVSKQDLAIISSVPGIVGRLALNDEVWINDGRIGARAVARSPEAVRLKIFAAREKGEKVKVEKGLNFPHIDLGLPALGAADIEALDFIVTHADLVGFSFVQTPEDVELLQDHIAARRGDRPPLGIVLKIETPLAVENLPRLIVQAARHNPTAVMIARGDLAVELGFERLSEIQEEILWLCEAAHAPVIWATQVLDGLVKDGLPSRAEMTDAAMAQRSECVMLNKGPHLVEGVTALRHVLKRMDRHQTKKFARFGPLNSWR
ncbi:MAG: pyruvate kinase [Hyphomicrobiales bacterium]|nr:pyruvate kinase [Hyphomicrobiales bacterium]